MRERSEPKARHLRQQDSNDYSSKPLIQDPFNCKHCHEDLMPKPQNNFENRGK
jgi:hypothetical protein